MGTERIIDRIRKLLELSKSTNEHEAASAGARAAALMAEHGIAEAMLSVAGDEPAYTPEGITEEHLGEDFCSTKRVAYRDRITSAVAASFDCHTWYSGGNLKAMGRVSAVQSWIYTSQYLVREVERLAEEKWKVLLDNRIYRQAAARTWKGSFRLGAADTIAERLRVAHLARRSQEGAEVTKAADASTADHSVALVRASKTLEILKRDRAEVDAAYEKRSEKFRKAPGIGMARSHSGYHAGREAGQTIGLGGNSKALGSGQRKIGGAK